MKYVRITLRIIVFTLCFIFLLPLATVEAKESSISIIIEGEIITETPIIVNDRALIPIRTVLEHLGANVNYNNGLITITNSIQTVEFRAGELNFTINGEIAQTDQPAIVRNNITYVPVRFMANAFGYEVYFDHYKRKIHLAGTSHSDIKISNKFTDNSIVQISGQL